MFLGKVKPQEVWARDMLAAVPGEWRGRVEKIHNGKVGATSDTLRAGNLWLLGVSERVSAWRVPLGASEHELCALAKKAARECIDLAETTHGMAALRAKMAERAEAWGLTPPKPATVDQCTGEVKGIQDDGAVRRMSDHLWWRRGLRKVQARAVEAEAIRLGYVHKQAELYASDLTVTRRLQQKRRNLDGLQNTVARNTETDQEFSLYELAARSVANPEIRRGELMTRIAGFDAVARGLNHARDFWTGTCPSAYHAKETSGAGWVHDNKHYDGKTPREGRDYLGGIWARFRAWAARRGLAFYGFRIAEPHHDGTPHWHLLMFSERRAMPRLRAMFRRYLLKLEGVKAPRVKDVGREGLHAWHVANRRKENADRGRRAHAAKFEAIREGESAAGYVAKYVSKNIDGYKVQFDLEGDDYAAVTGSKRVEAWAAAWGIRQFQQVGGPPVGIWRELRRIPAADVEVSGDAMAAAHAACNKTETKGADFGAYIAAMGGPTTRRDALPLELAKTDAGQKWSRAAGSALPCPLNRYGEETPPAVFGVREVGRRGRLFVSNRYTWEIKRNGATPTVLDQRRQAEGIPGTEGGRARAPAIADCKRNENEAAAAGENVTGRDCDRGAIGKRNGVGFVVGRPAQPAGPWSPVNNCTGVEFEHEEESGADRSANGRSTRQAEGNAAFAVGYSPAIEGSGLSDYGNGGGNRRD